MKSSDPAKRYITYLRVSTAQQGASGLGLAAQEESISRHVAAGAPVVASYREVESGRNDARPELKRAIDHARRAGAVLLVAKLDRLARSASFLLALLDSGVHAEFADLPQVSGPQGRFLLTSMAAVAELEAGLTSERTVAALRAAKARGQKLGNPNGAAALRRYEAVHGHVAAIEGKARAASERAESYRAIIGELVAAGLSLKAMASALNERGEHSVAGVANGWTATAVRRLLARLGIDRVQPASTESVSVAA